MITIYICHIEFFVGFERAQQVVAIIVTRPLAPYASTPPKGGATP